MVCAADDVGTMPTAARDACQGDSGGPLMVRDSGRGVRPRRRRLVGHRMRRPRLPRCLRAHRRRSSARVGDGADPHADFSFNPPNPTAGQTVSFTASSGPSGYFGSYAWDLDGDGAYDDAVGTSTLRSFAAGAHTVGVQAIGAGASDAVDSRHTIGVAPQPPDTTRPVVSSVSATPGRFRVAPLRRPGEGSRRDRQGHEVPVPALGGGARGVHRQASVAWAAGGQALRQADRAQPRQAALHPVRDVRPLRRDRTSPAG